MGKLDIIVKTLEDKQAYDIKVIDLENKSSIADYFVLATGNSINQNKALIEYIEENLKKEGFDVLSIEGLREGKWILMDCGEVIVHIFSSNQREFYNIEDLFDTYAIGGVDLSSTTDLTCATLLIIKHNKKFIIQQYFIPSERLEFKIKDDKIPYDKWEKRGLVTICEGAKVNYSDVTQWFLKMHNEYDISALWIGYDPWNTQYWEEEMKEQGFEMVEVRQGAKTMSNPMKQLEADLIEKNVNYNNNPVLKWCLCNTAVKRDENDNIRPVKGQKQRARIDGTVSLIIAYCVLFDKLNDYLALQEE